MTLEQLQDLQDLLIEWVEAGHDTDRHTLNRVREAVNEAQDKQDESEMATWQHELAYGSQQ